MEPAICNHDRDTFPHVLCVRKKIELRNRIVWWGSLNNYFNSVLKQLILVTCQWLIFHQCEVSDAHRILVWKLHRKDHFKDLDVDDRTILRWIVKKLEVRAWITFMWFTIGTSENGNEPNGSIKDEEFLDQLNYYKFLENDSAPWVNYLVSDTFLTNAMVRSN